MSADALFIVSFYFVILCHYNFLVRLAYYAPPPRRGHYAMMLSDVCLSVAYIGPKSRTERPAKNKIGTEVSHVTRDSDTTFKIKRLNVNCQGHQAALLSAALTQR